MTSTLQTPFGLRDGVLYSPDQVMPGLACGCVCPGCGVALVAKQGQHRRWHFSHQEGYADRWCVESAIHAAAKQILLARKALFAPAYKLHARIVGSAGRHYEVTETLSPARWIRFEHAQAEVWIDPIRPDVVGYRGERRLLVEMYFRHRVDQDKRAKLIALGIPTLEIDLSDLDACVGFEAIEQRVIEDSACKEWLVYPQLDMHRQRLEQSLRDQCDADIAAAKEDAAARAAARREQEKRAAALAGLSRHLAETDDDAFRRRKPAGQDAWLRRHLGLTEPVPRFLQRDVPGADKLGVPAFLWQASVFQAFVHGQVNAAPFTTASVQERIARRFGWTASQTSATQVVGLYLAYLIRAGFLIEDVLAKRPAYKVRYDALSLPPWAALDVRLDDEPGALSEAQRAATRGHRWRDSMPRWGTMLNEAEALFADSPHRTALLAGLRDLSPLAPPGSPMHWAAMLAEQRVPVDVAMAALVRLGLAE